jgi:CRISPR-associated protein Cas1
MAKIINCLGYGRYLGVNKKAQAFVLYHDKEVIQESPFTKTDMILVSDGNTISSSALFYAGMFDVNTIILSQTGRLISTLRPVESENEPLLKMEQYNAYGKQRGLKIAKFIISGKIQSQIDFLESHNLDTRKNRNFLGNIARLKAKNIDEARRQINMWEAVSTRLYYESLFEMMDIDIIQSRKKRFAKDIFNNVMNLCYEVLKAECFRACYKARLDPYLGYLHAPKHGKPALVCDLQELYRTDIDLFVLANRDSIRFDKMVDYGGRMFLSSEASLDLILRLNEFFSEVIDTKIPYGTASKYARRTIIKFQARNIAQYLRKENKLNYI